MADPLYATVDIGQFLLRKGLKHYGWSLVLSGGFVMIGILPKRLHGRWVSVSSSLALVWPVYLWAVLGVLHGARHWATWLYYGLPAAHHDLGPTMPGRHFMILPFVVMLSVAALLIMRGRRVPIRDLGRQVLRLVFVIVLVALDWLLLETMHVRMFPGDPWHVNHWLGGD